jgi:hypothetical protein
MPQVFLGSAGKTLRLAPHRRVFVCPQPSDHFAGGVQTTASLST